MIRDITARYLTSLEADASPSRSPLQQRNRNLGKPSKLESPDLEDMARQMNLDTPTMAPLRKRFDTPSATVRSFKNTTKGGASGSNGANGANTNGSNRTNGINGTNGTDRTNGANGTNGAQTRAKAGAKSGKDSVAYEYLCRIQAIKNWLQKVLGEDIPQSAAELIPYMQNGIYLAKLANLFLPKQKPVFMDDSSLQFRHTENINRFFKLLAHLEIPSLLHFELTDLYDAKDVPKVFFCLHAMSFKINTLGEYPLMENLVGEASFSSADLRVASRALLGHNLPNFASTDGYDLSSPGKNTYMSETLGSPVSKKSAVSLSPVKDPSSAPFSPTKTSAPFTPVSFPRGPNDNPFLDKDVDLLATKTPNLPPLSYHLKTEPRLAANTGEETGKETVEDNAPESALESAVSISSPEGTTPISSLEVTAPTASLQEHTPNIIKLQALCKGSILRYDMFVKKIMIRSYDQELTQLFAKIRANLSRLRSVHVHRDELILFEDEIVALQSAARAKFSQRSHGLEMLHNQEAQVLSLQSVWRGKAVRQNLDAMRRHLSSWEGSATALQSALRSRVVRKPVLLVMENRPVLEPQVLALQAVSRSKLFRQSQRSSMVKSLTDQDTKIVEVQSILRGAMSRNEIRRKLAGISRNRRKISGLQNVARGAILRTRLCNQVLITLIGEDIKMNELFAKVRGNGVRSRIHNTKARLDSSSVGWRVTQLQAKFRAILVRYQNYIDLMDIYKCVDATIQLQAVIRGRKQLTKHTRIRQHYERNVEAVVRAQSILKAKYEQNAYKSFVQMKNPPIKVIRKFASLLIDSGRDVEEEKQLFQLKEQIMQKCRRNEELESQIESIDKKLILLDKNKISIEEFAKNSNSSMKLGRSETRKSRRWSTLNQSAQKRIELYQHLFYFLQTKPVYWLRLLEQAPPADKAGMESLKHHIMSIFAIPRVNGQAVEKSREEYFFMRFVTELMHKDYKLHSRNITDITKLKSTFWLDFVIEFNNGSAQRLALKKLLGAEVQRLVDEDEDETNFESDPLEIWTALRNKELGIYGSSLMREKVTPQEAIQDKNVNERFVTNLMNLRDFTHEVVNKLAAHADRVPIHMRILMKKAYEQSKIEHPNTKEYVHLSIAGVVFIKYFINNLLVFPENFGIHVKHAVAETNLRYLSRVLVQVFSMKAFKDNFLKPLNDFVMQCRPQVQGAIKSMMHVAEMEDEYAMNDWKDLTSHQRPQLTMKLSDMIGVEEVLSHNLQVMVPNADDQLYSLVQEFHDNTSMDDYVTLTELGSYTLSLVPQTREDTIRDSKRDMLFAQAKKGLLLMLRVQNIDSNDLLELLIQAITPEHEAQFQRIQELEAPASLVLQDLHSPSYKELKKTTLKTLLQLESMGEIRRDNSYQELLNQIVVDIKTKDGSRVRRRQQLSFAGDTLAKLNHKEAFLSSQLSDYHKHVECMLQELQRRPKDRKLFNIIPIFSKQYFYHRQLKRSHRLPKFGSYKYSLKKLMDQGVVDDVSGALFQKAASASRCEFMFSCHQAGEFVVEVANGPVTVPGACTTFSLDELLSRQDENHRSWTMFEGMVVFNMAAFSALIFSKFYDISK